MVHGKPQDDGVLEGPVQTLEAGIYFQMFHVETMVGAHRIDNLEYLIESLEHRIDNLEQAVRTEVLNETRAKDLEEALANGTSLEIVHEWVPAGSFQATVFEWNLNEKAHVASVDPIPEADAGRHHEPAPLSSLPVVHKAEVPIESHSGVGPDGTLHVVHHVEVLFDTLAAVVHFENSALNRSLERRPRMFHAEIVAPSRAKVLVLDSFESHLLVTEKVDAVALCLWHNQL